MNQEQLVGEVRRIGHEIGSAAISNDGFMLLDVDGRMMKFEEAERVLRKRAMTEDERKVIDILVAAGITQDAWHTPIHVVDRAMGWPTAKTEIFVRDLMARNLVLWAPIAGDGATWDPKARWEEPRVDLI